MPRVAPSAIVVLGLLSCLSEERSGSLEPRQASKAGFALLERERISACPSDMLQIEGDFCPTIEQRCLRWLDPDNKGANGPARCAEFAPTRCLSTKTMRKNFCIDVYEFPNVLGAKPTLWISYNDGKRECGKLNKRLCTRSEWTFACEGPHMQPYPYGDGLHRDSTACNIDRPWKNPDTHTKNELDQSVPSGSMPRCVSPFGVYDMVGNGDEAVENESRTPYASGLSGGHWALGARNRCRPMTDAHREDFAWYETGARCCKNANNINGVQAK